MDFKKIEWIFFLAFLGLNIFLFSLYHDAQSDENNVSMSNQKIDIEQRLASDKIKYSGELSNEKLEGYYLSGEQTDLAQILEEDAGNQSLQNGTTVEDDELTHVTSENYYISDDKKTESALKNFLSKESQILFGTEYEYLPNYSLTDEEYPEVVAAQTFETIPFNDPTSRVTISLEKVDDLLKIARYTQTHLSQIEKLREKMTLYTEKDAINTLYINNKIPSKSRIVWRQLAYTRILKVREKNVYVPAWFVAIKTGDDLVQVEMVNAFSNRIITNNTLQKVENS
ncbi:MULTISPECIES: two-component system regulatory protein YycI [Enterococcus]|uniref:two-component system regulatory protein YycI n=1 Tax=Enterococcus TaxID=1350 RepID=UPI00065E3FA2|nr:MULTISPECIES: two-component system regulatory protein YycI [Enterococcus]KAF1300760.1 hypothetical protein BAU16_11810 [Enterococcus sp. JM9B]